MATKLFRLIDIGVNLTDSVFRGAYHGSQKHEDDFHRILERAYDVGMKRMIVTSGCLSDCSEALNVCNTYPDLFTTVGCHPTRCKEFEDISKCSSPQDYLESLGTLIADNKAKVVAVGECGLDYDRLHFCDAGTQRNYFEMQIKLAADSNLPLFLHHRNCHQDFKEIILRNLDSMPRKGVVHSFDGTIEQANFFLEKGFFIGINGCSLKTEDNLNVVKQLPVDRLMIETDAPWCEIKPSHASSNLVKTKFPSVKKEKWQSECLVKGRNEPCCIIQVLEVLSGLKQIDPHVLAEDIYQNTMKLFFPTEL